ncbi:MAG TPA: VWA domain-containing protein [Candidatus Sulfotelmatobacter sp.]|jgi:hypothetical protein|nr:VWA domain-containing protein [Candidatus Sulfotelmatobacter sp.]
MNRLEMSLLLTLFVLLATTGIAQSTPDCKNGLIVVTALDAHGLPVRNLTARDFQLSYRGKGVKVTSPEYWNNPVARVVVLLDLSGSMRGGMGSDKWKVAHTMASAYVLAAPPKEQISLLSFADTVQQKFAAADGRTPIQEWLSSVPVREGQVLKGRTALYQAILAGINQLTPAEPGDAI